MSGEGPEVYRRAQAHSMEEAAALVERALGRKVVSTERDRVAGSRAVYGKRELLAPEETLPQRLWLYQALYALDHLWWEHSFRNERGVEEAQERLRRFEEALDRS